MNWSNLRRYRPAMLFALVISAVLLLFLLVSQAFGQGTPLWAKLLLFVVVLATGAATLLADKDFPTQLSAWREWIKPQRLAILVLAASSGLGVLADTLSIFGPRDDLAQNVGELVDKMDAYDKEAQTPLPDLIKPPELDGAFLFSGTAITARTQPPSWMHFTPDKKIENRKIAGELYVYGHFTDGPTYLLGVNPDGEIDTKRVPDSLSSCGIVAKPGESGRYLYKRQTWKKKVYSTEIRYELDESGSVMESRNAKICHIDAKGISDLERPHGVVDVKDLPFPMFEVFAIIPGKQATIGFTSSNTGLKDRVGGGKAILFARRQGRWVQTHAFDKAFLFDDAFDHDLRQVPMTAIAGERMAVCTYRTEVAETFAGWSEFLPERRSDGRYRSVAEPIYRFVDGAHPCDDFLAGQ